MMKKLHLTAMAALLTFAAAAQDASLPKAFSFTVVPDGETEAVITSITTDAEGTHMLQIDWGDGQLTEPVAFEDYYTTWNPTAFRAVPKGETITVYAEPEVIHYIDGSWGTGTLKWTSVDITAVTALKNLNLASNALETIDFTKNVDLSSITVSGNNIKGAVEIPEDNVISIFNFSNTETLGTNNLQGTDFSKLKAAKTINVAYNALESLNVAGLENLATLNITACHLKDIDLTGCPALKTLNANLNDFETIDLSKCATNGPSIFLNNNKLSSITLAEAYTGKGKLNITNNYFTFATLPAADIMPTYNYSPQADITITAVDGKVDLSEYMPVIGENATVATWTNAGEALEEGKDYTVEGSVYTFLVSAPEAKVALTNAAFSKLTLNSNAVSIVTSGILNLGVEAADALYYNVNGMRVASDSMQPGIYIMVKGGKAHKVYVK